MKIVATVVTLATAGVVSFQPTLALAFTAAIFLVYLGVGILVSSTRGLDPLNDAPNALRVLLAAASPLLFVSLPQPIGSAAALLSFAAALLLNDEYQRRAIDSIRKGRVGGSVALLGIDGSGKSTHAEELERWFRDRGYYCTRVAFHRYLFVERLGRRGGATRAEGFRKGGNPLRPLLSVLDNLILLLVTSFGRGLEGRVVLYDRYIWSTYVKYAALGYPVRPLRWLYTFPRPRFAVVLDIAISKSLAVIQGRPDHIRYQRGVLSAERDEYVRISRTTGFPLIDASRERTSVQSEIEYRLAEAFPVRGR